MQFFCGHQKWQKEVLFRYSFIENYPADWECGYLSSKVLVWRRSCKVRTCIFWQKEVLFWYNFIKIYPSDWECGYLSSTVFVYRRSSKVRTCYFLLYIEGCLCLILWFSMAASLYISLPPSNHTTLYGGHKYIDQQNICSAVCLALPGRMAYCLPYYVLRHKI